MNRLTDRQAKVLDLIKDHISRHGFPPTLREIADGLSLAGTRGVVKHLEALERKGVLKRSPGSSRGIELMVRSFALPASGVVPVPVLGQVPAGPLDLAVEERTGTIMLDGSVAGEDTFLLQVTGDSMSGDHIREGDLVLVRKQDDAESGDLVVAMVDGEATVKRFKRRRNKITLEPSNPVYSPLVFSAGDIDLSIIGRVKAVIRLLDR